MMPKVLFTSPQEVKECWCYLPLLQPDACVEGLHQKNLVNKHSNEVDIYRGYPSRDCLSLLRLRSRGMVRSLASHGRCQWFDPSRRRPSQITYKNRFKEPEQWRNESQSSVIIDRFSPLWYQQIKGNIATNIVYNISSVSYRHEHQSSPLSLVKLL